MFAYSFNNPVNLIDESGKWPTASQIFAGIAIAGAAVAVGALVVAAAPVVVGGAVVVSATALTVAQGSMIVSGVCATAAVVTNAVEKAQKINYGQAHDQSVYVMRDRKTKEAKYVGRTKDPVRRAKEHARDPKKAHLGSPEVVFTGLIKAQARKMEQLLISAYTLQDLDNARRKIAVENLRGFLIAWII